MSKSAEQNIINFLKENPSWFAAAHLQRQLFQNKNGTYASPKAISRRLQENAEGDNAILEVEYRHNHAFYKIKEAHIKKRQIVTQNPDGSVRVEYIPVSQETAQERRGNEIKSHPREFTEANSN